MAKIAGILSVLLIAAGCSKPGQKLADLSEEFVNTTLSFSPINATAIGLHTWQKQKLDDLLDDNSPQNLDRQKHFYEEFQQRLSQLPAARLTPEEQADLTMMQDQCSLAILEFDQIHTALHNPTMYVEALGNALFNPYVLEYAPKRDRFLSIIARLQKVSLFLDQARANLGTAPEIWTRVAMEENEGNIALADKTIRADVPADLASEYARAAGPALDAMRKFQNYMKNALPTQGKYDWRLGKDRYMSKFRLALEGGVEADTALQRAERELPAVRQRMLDLALPLHRQMEPRHGDHSDLTGEVRENTVIGEVLNHIAANHSTRQSYMDDARKDLEEARAFVQQKRLLTLPTRANLQVIPTPEFMRGIYSVGGFNSAPALEPQLGAFYWVTPIPDAWPPERVESKLREYNFYKLKLLTIHEAMPGHYVQMEIANDVQPKTRRVLRSVLGNGPYIEGWAQFATQMMLDEGFLDHSPEMALTFAKEELRVIANIILDVRLQMLNMTDEEAMDLMMKQTFQEQEEAAGKLQRAKLSAAQLPMYYIGWRGWQKVRSEYQKSKGASYSLSTFNDAVLREGAVPLPTLGRLLH